MRWIKTVDGRRPPEREVQLESRGVRGQFRFTRTEVRVRRDAVQTNLGARGHPAKPRGAQFAALREQGSEAPRRAPGHAAIGKRGKRCPARRYAGGQTRHRQRNTKARCTLEQRVRVCRCGSLRRALG